MKTERGFQRVSMCCRRYLENEGSENKSTKGKQRKVTNIERREGKKPTQANMDRCERQKNREGQRENEQSVGYSLRVWAKPQASRWNAKSTRATGKSLI